VSTTGGAPPHPVIEGVDVVLRPTTEADLDLLVGWFARPDVVRYWGGAPLSEDEVAAKYVGRRRPAVECFIVQIGETPAGWIQYHLVGERRGGVDMVLLEEHRGRGVGRAAVRALVEFLLGRLHWSEVTVDPDDWNAGGKAFWASVGFEPSGIVVDDGDREPYVLMRWNGPR
jgi:aminoglycoside 6'-N-acetyltransferase